MTYGADVKKWYTKATAFFKRTEGMETVEYAVMTTLIVAAIIGSLVLLGTAVLARYEVITAIIN